jgi:hypothetical protein
VLVSFVTALQTREEMKLTELLLLHPSPRADLVATETHNSTQSRLKIPPKKRTRKNQNPRNQLISDPNR